MRPAVQGSYPSDAAISADTSGLTRSPLLSLRLLARRGHVKLSPTIRIWNSKSVHVKCRHFAIVFADGSTFGTGRGIAGRCTVNTSVDRELSSMYH